MARFRRYKNGVIAHRYKGYYVTRQIATHTQKKTYTVLDKDLKPVMRGFTSYWDAEWAIDKLTAPPELKKIIEELYGEDVYMLSKFFLELMEKEQSEGLDPSEREFFSWVQKIRARKADGKGY